MLKQHMALGEVDRSLEASIQPIKSLSEKTRSLSYTGARELVKEALRRAPSNTVSTAGDQEGLQLLHKQEYLIALLSGMEPWTMEVCECKGWICEGHTGVQIKC
jgi:hypothetical protein